MANTVSSSCKTLVTPVERIRFCSSKWTDRQTDWELSTTAWFLCFLHGSDASVMDYTRG